MQIMLGYRKTTYGILLQNEPMEAQGLSFLFDYSEPLVRGFPALHYGIQVEFPTLYWLTESNQAAFRQDFPELDPFDFFYTLSGVVNARLQFMKDTYFGMYLDFRAGAFVDSGEKHIYGRKLEDDEENYFKDMSGGFLGLGLHIWVRY